MKARILLADDHKIMRDGLRALLDALPGIEVVGEAENGRVMVRMVRQVPADLVIMDVGMPDLNGIEATREILSIAPDMKVVALSMHSDKRYVSEMFRAGAAGYLLKDCAFEELARAIQVVMAGQSYISPPIAESMIRDFLENSPTDPTSPYSILTPREREVLQLIAEGYSVRQIASHLNISTKTVEKHRQHIMTRLSLSNMADLIKYAIREGLTSAEQG
jgi:DNA-binding NarL/FixJ family response regulator